MQQLQNFRSNLYSKWVFICTSIAPILNFASTRRCAQKVCLYWTGSLNGNAIYGRHTFAYFIHDNLSQNIFNWTFCQSIVINCKKPTFFIFFLNRKQLASVINTTFLYARLARINKMDKTIKMNGKTRFFFVMSISIANAARLANCRFNGHHFQWLASNGLQ